MSGTKNDAAHTRVRLAPGIYLRDGEASGAQVVLVCPEGNVQLNSMAGAILALCDGSRDRHQVVAEVLKQTGNRARSADILDFLNAAVARDWIQEA
ncbi:MAG TPA: pyrroloquinoline quinone biosynthesis peptide chaperone PqqD [Steroidobacteraceae bacterium]|nr:pyrroloquinoline quinone biosynthesis peptide chaperone PqqD [Steroidobacteraceae bacterium]